MEQATEKRILILEDAREDRLRFRYLFEEDLGLKPEQFEFAWAWPRVSSTERGVLEWFCQKINISCENSNLNEILKVSQEKDQSAWLCNYALILLDLAWSADAERCMGDMQLLPPGTGRKMASKEIQQLQDLYQNVEGIQFLEWWKNLEIESKPQVWISSAYLPSTAWEMREFLIMRYQPEEMFHKWNDEAVLLCKTRIFLENFSYSDLQLEYDS